MSDSVTVRVAKSLGSWWCSCVLIGRALETQTKTSIAHLNLSLAHLLSKENGDCEFVHRRPKLNLNSLPKSQF